jgi:subtilase family serine protease
LSANLPAGVSGSGQFILAVIDADNTVVECDENNNVIVFGPVP